MMPIYAGAKKGLPILDANGAGRAVPELEMLMFHFYDIPPSPFAIADKKAIKLLFILKILMTART